MPSAEYPKISVITVNLNMADDITGTLDSALAQNYPNVESVVIDGGSSDNSRAIIESYASKLGYWVSERDQNLYDGMNKGVAAATGEWIIFMNAGDRFAAPNVLSHVFATSHNDADVLYGHHVRRYVRQGIDRTMLAESPEVLPRRMNCSHQAMLIRRPILLERPFALDLLIADYDAILAAYSGGKRFRPVDCVIAVTVQGGRSDIQRFRALKERVMLVRRSGLMTFPVALYYARLYFGTMLAIALKKILPDRLVSTVLRHRPVKRMG
jgi:putative colanic acid biosynthesis glycosyltransferase